MSEITKKSIKMSLCVVQWNMQGKNNLPEFRNYVETNTIHPDIICLQETKANPKKTLCQIYHLMQNQFTKTEQKRKAVVWQYTSKIILPLKRLIKAQ